VKDILDVILYIQIYVISIYHYKNYFK